MKRSFRAGLLCAALLLSGCGRYITSPCADPESPAATVAPDGDPHTVTCRGSYTGTGNTDTVIARIGDDALTNEALQLWYEAEIAQYRQQNPDIGPDLSLPLDIQPCTVDDSVHSWQQYFLRAALNRWHTAQSLIRHSQEVPLPTEVAYKGDPELLAKYMSEMPATRLLYGYDPYYHPNSQHHRYLDELEQKFHGPLLAMARTLNYSYMYFTTLSYDLVPESSASETGSAPRIRFRHILLKPEEGDIRKASELLNTWQTGKNSGEATFAQLASRYSRDTATARSGGLYSGLLRSQLPEDLARWCFAEDRKEGDTAIIPTEEGVHILYFSAWETGLESRLEQRRLVQQELLQQIRNDYPLEVDYTNIALSGDFTTPSLSELLYPDIAHQRFPEVPLYLQQNYTGTMYGEYKLTTNGCGITSLAMLSSYLCDEELTPPELSERYGRYSRPTGTAASLFDEAPPQLGFYLLKKTYDWREAREYMKEGYSVIVCQYKGYWTGGGHYLVLESLTEDGLVQVRDSNLYNYRKLPRHKDDAFPWDTICSAGQGYWIYEKKVTSIDACVRCGDPEALEFQLVTDYLCEKCRTALCRRDAYLSCFA